MPTEAAYAYEARRQPARSHSTGVTVEETIREAFEPSPISSKAIAFSGPEGTHERCLPRGLISFCVSQSVGRGTCATHTFISEPAGTNGP